MVSRESFAGRKILGRTRAAAVGVFLLVAAVDFVLSISGCADLWNFHELTLASSSTDGSTDAIATGQLGPDGAFDAAATDAPQHADALCTMCSGHCVDLTTDHDHCGGCVTSCASTQVCQRGACACAANQTLCNAPAGPTCLDVMTNASNCGSCGSACVGGTVCQAGKCICPGDEKLCATGAGPACTYLTSDHGNCGACGASCPLGASCQSSACMCLAGQTLCGAGASAVCADTMTDHANCGGCGTACSTGAACVSGRCTPCASMVAGKMCGTPPTCVDTATDHANCGGCGNPCLATQVCQGGQCNCPMGETACGSGPAQSCVTLSSDQNNCGKCGVACTGGMVCQSSACACPSGFHNCSGTCVPDSSTSTSSCGTTCGVCPAPAGGQATCTGTPLTCGQQCPAASPTLCGKGASAVCADTATDPGNCGACGAACNMSNAVEKCVSSTCSIVACSAGWADCDVNPANGCETHTASDPTNCGQCGQACPLGASCSGGACSNCSPGTLLCGNACFACPPQPANGSYACSNGACVASCPNAGFPNLCGSGLTAECVNTQTDQNNCGACGAACTPTADGGPPSCSAGVCAL